MRSHRDVDRVTFRSEEGGALHRMPGQVVTELLRSGDRPALFVVHLGRVTVADLVSVPFVGPASIGALIVRALLSEGVDIMSSGKSTLRRGTPVFVKADAETEEVMKRLRDVRVTVIPVLDGVKLVGFFEVNDGSAAGGRPTPDP